MNQLPHGNERAIPPSILIHGDQTLVFGGEAHKFLGFLQRWREWLFDDDMASGLERSFAIREMRVVGSRDNDDVDRLVGKHFVKRSRDSDFGISCFRVGVWRSRTQASSMPLMPRIMGA